MKIILDAMALGAGYENPRGRTGVFRVVNYLLEGIQADASSDLSLIATGFPKEVELFLRSNNLQTLKYPLFEDRVIQKLNNLMIKYGLRNTPLLSTNLEQLLKVSDIYHSPYMPIPDAVTKQTKAKSFLTVHDLIPIMYPDYFNSVEKSLVQVAIESALDSGYFFCVSESTKNDLCNTYKIDPDRVRVTYLAASKSLFYVIQDDIKIEEVKLKYNIGPEPYFLSLCTLEPRKNIEQTIKSFLAVVEQNSLNDVKLVLIGSKGWQFDSIFNEINANTNSKSKIVVTGFVDDADLAYLYNGAMGFIYPSFYEGFGLPPLEAMQCGLPVIVSNTSSLPEVVGSAGILVDPKDGDSLSEAILTLYRNPSLRESFSEKSISQASKFNWDKFTQETISGYDLAIS
jgi:glycosyltransferase involved in cell wall biosynthesis